MTQREQVLEMLRRNPWVCGVQFHEAGIYRYSARIHELRRQGCLIDSRRCDRPYHQHRDGQMDEWRLVWEPSRDAQPRLVVA